ASDGGDGRAAANWVTDLRARLGAEADPGASRVDPDALAWLVRQVADRKVPAGAARTVLDRLVAGGGDPAEIVEREGLGAMGGGRLRAGRSRPPGAQAPAAAQQFRR